MPASVNMGIHVDSLDVERMIDREVEKLSKVDEALAEVGVNILRYNDERWGKGWKAEAASTQEQKKGQEVGVVSGKMKAAATRPGAPGQVHEIADGKLLLGFDRSLFYGRFFAKGTKTHGVRGGGKSVPGQPKRSVMRLTPTVRKSIKETLKQKLMPGEHDVGTL
jgi:hypothetical protein